MAIPAKERLADGCYIFILYIYHKSTYAVICNEKCFHRFIISNKQHFWGDEKNNGWIFSFSSR